MPVDEAAKRPDFFTFRARLQVVVAERDVEALVAAADPNIRMGFGGEDGVVYLREQMTGPRAPGIWKELARILALGGAFKTASSFYAPYVSSNWPEGADAFECSAIIGSDVVLRSGPAADAPVVTRVSYAIVQELGQPISQPNGWSRVKLRSGQTGFVRSDYRLGATGLRVMFNEINGQWRMTMMVAGD